ncbi:hypothetical protein BYT27DRAFT_7215795 [Phlegmacium glaucopus]|nr:hypothetical protein BYT27DRAFT_7215795 [Phlegmacium glaucopus]
MDIHIRSQDCIFMWGPSVFNTQIERLWVEVGRCLYFCDEWNAHPLPGVAGGHSPNDLVFMGELQYGTYDNKCKGLTPEEVNDEEQEEYSSDNYEESEVNMELDIPGSGEVIDPDHDFDMEGIDANI